MVHILSNEQVFRKYVNFSSLTRWLRGPNLARGSQFGDPWLKPTNQQRNASTMIIKSANIMGVDDATHRRMCATICNGC